MQLAADFPRLTANGSPLTASDSGPQAVSRKPSDLLPVRPATADDVAGCLALHNEHFHANRTSDFWHWKYSRHLPGRSVYVVASDNGRVVGTQGMIPVKLRSSGGVELTGKSENSLVAAAYQGQGLWNRLYRAALDECRSRGMSSVWGFTPVERARRGLLRLGFSVHDVMVQAIAVTNVRQGIEVFRRSSEPVHHKLGASLLAPAARVRARLAAALARPAPGLEVCSGPFPAGASHEEIRGLYEGMSGTCPGLIHLEMDTDYVNWRIREHPWFRYAAWCCRERGRLTAFAVVNEHDPLRPAILELAFSAECHAAALLAAMTGELGRRGAGVVTFWANRANRYGRLLLESAGRLGFFCRPAHSSFVALDIDGETGTRQRHPERWLLSALWYEGYAL